VIRASACDDVDEGFDASYNSTVDTNRRGQPRKGRKGKRKRKRKRNPQTKIDSRLSHFVFIFPVLLVEPFVVVCSVED
jgi:hypothetical protein